MPFFEDIDALGVVEDHIQKVQRLEEEEAERVLSVYREIRGKLQDRLLVLPPDSFTAQQVRGVLLQVEGAIQAMSDSLLEQMGFAFDAFTDTGISHLRREVEAFDEHFRGAVVPINIDAVLVATDNRNFLFNRYEASIAAYSADLRSMLATGITEMIAQEAGKERTITQLGRFFLGEQWKLRRIIRTELHHIYGAAKQRSMKSLIDTEQLPDLKKALVHPMDHRTANDSKALAVENPIVEVDEPFRFKWRGEWRVFMFPPDRPNDRAICVPYRDAWGAP